MTRLDPDYENRSLDEPYWTRRQAEAIRDMLVTEKRCTLCDGTGGSGSAVAHEISRS